MDFKLPTNAIGLLEGFLAIAETLNVSQAARKIGVSRVTLQNRMRLLEELCGYKLLELEHDNRYRLTNAAELWLEDIKVWMREGRELFSLSDERSSGLLKNSPLGDDEQFYCQQHPLISLWEHNSPYLQSMLTAWLEAKGEFMSPAFKLVRDNGILARLHNDTFIITEIGSDAAMMEWLGEEWCLSAIGKPLPSTPMSSKADQVIMYSYRQSLLKGAPWYDHISAELPRPVKKTTERAFYRRLLLPSKLPDGSPLIASIVELSNELVIDGLEVLSKHQQSRGN